MKHFPLLTTVHEWQQGRVVMIVIKTLLEMLILEQIKMCLQKHLKFLSVGVSTEDISVLFCGSFNL